MYTLVIIVLSNKDLSHYQETQNSIYAVAKRITNFHLIHSSLALDGGGGGAKE